jgi:hypothetical protein
MGRFSGCRRASREFSSGYQSNSRASTRRIALGIVDEPDTGTMNAILNSSMEVRRDNEQDGQ